jgi:hypothetical protein
LKAHQQSRSSARPLGLPLACAGAALIATATLTGCGGAQSHRRGQSAEAETRSATSIAEVGASTSSPASTATASSAAGNGGAPAGAGAQSDDSAITSTRTESAPAFVHGESGSRALAGALAVLKRAGYAPISTATYNPEDALRVLVGARPGVEEGHRQQAFFFLDERYLGTDSSSPSGSISVVGSGVDEVTLAYALYRPHDPPCCASGGSVQVRFTLNNGALQPSRALPPLSQRR